MNLLDLLSSTVVESMHSNKEYKEDPSLAPSSLVPEKRSQRSSRKKNQVEEVLDSKTVEGHRWYLVKYRGLSDSENSWQPYENLDCEALIEEYEDKPTMKGIPAEVDATKRNLDAVKEALKVLGGKAFGGAIVEWICANRNDMLHAFGGDKKKLRYCVNGLLSARVNASIFEKKVYKENGTTKTEWMLADLNEPIESHHISSDNSPQKQKEEKVDPSNPAKSPETSEEENNEEPKSPIIEDETSKGSISPEENGNTNGLRKLSTRRTRTSLESGSSSPRANLLQQVIKEERNLHLGRSSRNSRGAIKKEGTLVSEEKEDFYDENLPNQTELEDQMEEEDNESYQTEGAVGGVPQTYRGMIKVALEYMGGQATFESISKFIGTRFKDQLINKAETWKHSIAGCLSVYFARKEQKDPSGKVIWTLGEPPKPKRRGRKRDRDDVTRSPEREVSKGKRKKEDMVMIPVEQLEALEEENECLKLVVVKKKKDVKTLLENSNANFNTEPCEACHERKELYMILNPCGHLFCGSIFCEASTAKQCMICNAVITTRLPARKGKGSTFVQKRNNALANKEFSKTGNVSNQNHANLVD